MNYHIAVASLFYTTMITEFYINKWLDGEMCTDLASDFGIGTCLWYMPIPLMKKRNESHTSI